MISDSQQPLFVTSELRSTSTNFARMNTADILSNLDDSVAAVSDVTEVTTTRLRGLASLGQHWRLSLRSGGADTAPQSDGKVQTSCSWLIRK